MQPPEIKPPQRTPDSSGYIVQNQFLLGGTFAASLLIGLIWLGGIFEGLIALADSSFLAIVLAGMSIIVALGVARMVFDKNKEWRSRAEIREVYQNGAYWALGAIGALLVFMVLCSLMTNTSLGFMGSSPLAALQLYLGLQIRTPKLFCPSCGIHIDTEHAWWCKTCRPWTKNKGGPYNSFLGACFKCRKEPEEIECPAPECHCIVRLDNPKEAVVEYGNAKRHARTSLVFEVGEIQTPEHEYLHETQEERSRHETLRKIKEEEEKIYDIRREYSVHSSEEAATLREKQEERERAEKEYAAHKEDEAIWDLKKRTRQVDKPEAKTLEQKLEQEAENFLRQNMGVELTAERLKRKVSDWDLSPDMKEIAEEVLEAWKENHIRKNMDKGK